VTSTPNERETGGRAMTGATPRLVGLIVFLGGIVMIVMVFLWAYALYGSVGDELNQVAISQAIPTINPAASDSDSPTWLRGVRLCRQSQARRPPTVEQRASRCIFPVPAAFLAGPVPPVGRDCSVAVLCFPQVPRYLSPGRLSHHRCH